MAVASQRECKILTLYPQYGLVSEGECRALTPYFLYALVFEGEYRHLSCSLSALVFVGEYVHKYHIPCFALVTYNRACFPFNK